MLHVTGDEDSVYTVHMTWRQWVSWRRNELDITKAELVQVLDAMGFDTTRQTIWRIETGKVRTVETTREAVEAALDAVEAGRTARLESVA